MTSSPPEQTSPDPELVLLRPGVLFHGRYEVVRCIGSGGMGAVYEVLQRETRRRRALKTLLPSLVSDPEARARFHLEATVAAEIDSEHIVEVLDAGVDSATALPFLVLELLKGDNLADVLKQRGALPPREVCALLRQVSRALDRTHAASVIHRDLKPENLFLTRRDDGTPHVKLLDFGVAKIVAQSTLASTTRSLGTPLYMSPEQIRGDGNIGPAADLYSLAHIAFTLLVGTPYFEPEARGAGVYALLVKIMEGNPEPASVRATRRAVPLSGAFDAWFLRATALVPERRFETATELLDALELALGLRNATLVSAGPSGHSRAASAPALTAVVATAPSVAPAQSRVSSSTVGGIAGSPEHSVSSGKMAGRAWPWAIFGLGGALTAILVWRFVESAPSVSARATRGTQELVTAEPSGSQPSILVLPVTASGAPPLPSPTSTPRIDAPLASTGQALQNPASQALQNPASQALQNPASQAPRNPARQAPQRPARQTPPSVSPKASVSSGRTPQPKGSSSAPPGSHASTRPADPTDIR